VVLCGGLAAAMAAAAPAAVGAPAAGHVDVRNEAGALVGGSITGADAIRAAFARVRAGTLARVEDNRVWTIEVGPGAFGDFIANEPNITVIGSGDGASRIVGIGRVDDTGGGCADVRRGGVRLENLVCRTPAGRGFDVTAPVADPPVVLVDLVVDGAGRDGIAVTGTSSAILQGVLVLRSKIDGIRLAKLTGPGPYLVRGASVRQSGDDGIDLADDVVRAVISGATVDASADNGIESIDRESSDVTIDSSVITNSGDDGVLFGPGLRLSLLNSQVSGNARHGVNLAAGNGIVLRGLKLDGTNGGGDLRFSPDTRTGGTYDALSFLDSPLNLPGEPTNVVLSSLHPVRAAMLSPLPAGLTALGRAVVVRRPSLAATSAVTLQFPLGPNRLEALRTGALAVYEDDPPGNNGQWEAMPGTTAAGDAVQVALRDGQIGSGSDRAAVFAPLAPPNSAPAVGAVYPPPRSVRVGRKLIVSARVGDDEPLSTGSFVLNVDGRRRGGVSLSGDTVRFRMSLAPGRHRADLLVVDRNGLTVARTWTFQVRNAPPTVRSRVAQPRPEAFVLSRRFVRISVPVGDDQPVVRTRVGLRVDGRAVPFTLRRGRVEARAALSEGRHRVVVLVRDPDGARTLRSWTFRAVRP
jgi:hypothetical protein